MINGELQQTASLSTVRLKADPTVMGGRHVAVVLAAILIVAPSCARHDAPPEAPRARRSFELGAHSVQVDVPPDWDVLDQGSQKRFRKGELELVLQDLGPATPQGVQREVERARELWQADRAGEARLRLSNTRLPPDLFPTAATRQAFQSAWHAVVQSAGAAPFDEVEPAFDEMLIRLAAVPPRDLGEIADEGLAALGHDQRRDVKSRRAMTLDARDAVDLETWNRLSHTNPQRFIFLVNEGDLLVLYTSREGGAELVQAFASIRDSLHFADAGAAVTAR